MSPAFLRRPPAESPTHQGFAPPRAPDPWPPEDAALAHRPRPAERHGGGEMAAVQEGPGRSWRPGPTVVAVLCRPRHATAVGLAVGAALAGGRGPGALVCRWPEDTGARVPVGIARPGARRLCAALATRGVEARPIGRLVLADLPADPLEALSAAARAAAVAGDRPVVHVMAGPRPDELGKLLQTAARVLVAVETSEPGGDGLDTDGRLAALAVASLAAEGLDARPLPLSRPPGTPLLASLGAPGALRAALGSALEGLR
ncbi:MAG TPA: hypothetical protein VGV40_07850 [Solirubrobacteraceae bacterium]|nr:hypothetical protein [Solirubrobacteraceae bacterium]